MAKAVTILGSETLVAKEALSILKLSTAVVLLAKITELNSAVPIIPRNPFSPPIVGLIEIVWSPVPSKLPVRVNSSMREKSAPKANTVAGNGQVMATSQ